MTRVFDGHLYVHYGQAYVYAREDGELDFEEAFRGQVNGLCGAGCHGKLLLITGLHTGHVGFTVDILDTRPELDASWEEIVEVSLSIGEHAVRVEDWNGKIVTVIPLTPGIYRVRYCARNMDLGHEVDTNLDGEDAVDFYSMTIWSETASADCVLKQTSQSADYWHNFARNLKA